MFGCDLKTGGESGIRTHVTLSSKHAFQACAFSHSAISPATNLLPEDLPQVVICGKLLRARPRQPPKTPHHLHLRFYGRSSSNRKAKAWDCQSAARPTIEVSGVK